MSEKPESKSTEAAESLRGSTKASDSAYGSLTQSQRSGSSSKSQHSRSSGSNFSGDAQNNALSSAAAEPASTKTRKEKEPKKRKLIRSSLPSGLATSEQIPWTTAASSAASTSLVTSQAASSSAPLCSAALPPKGGETETAAASFSSPGNSGTPNTRRKYGSSSRAAAADFRVLQAAAVTRALDYLQSSRRLKDNISSKGESTSSSWKSVLTDPYLNDVRKHFSTLENLQSVQAKEAFAVVISLQDGVVVYSTSSLTDKLGFPADMWLGRFLLDFLHPKDRLTFTNSITASLLSGLTRDGKRIDDDARWRALADSAESSVCCRLRKYRGLKTTGFGIVEKKTSYIPFRIALCAEKLNVDKGEETKKETSAKETAEDAEDTCQEEQDGDYYLVAYAVPIVSAYNRSDEKMTSGYFGLRHSATCQFNEVERSFVPYLGHLPQDLLGASILDFYHPSDLPSLKEIYKKVINRQGRLVRSKPYNFRAFNGCYVLLETDWTCFVNPWTRKVEFVAGQYRVLRGPSNPDVFASPPDDEQDRSLSSGDSAFTESVEKIQTEIRTMLLGSAKPQTQQHTCSKSDAELQGAVARRRKDLAVLMGSIIDEMTKGKGVGCPCCCSSSVGSSGSLPGGGSLTGHASVVMGDISPHHGGSRNDSHSSDTPLSYTQLNYNENLQRYFQSQPKTMPSDGSGEGMTLESGGSGGSGGSKHDQDQTHNGSSEEDGGNAAGSGVQSSSPEESQQLSGSKSQSNSGSNSQTENLADLKAAPLTKELLNQHNEKMEEEFMQRHRVLRHKGGRPGCSRHERYSNQHGVKRTGASSWEEGGKQKHAHVDAVSPNDKCPTPPTTHVPSADASFAAQEGSTLTGATVMPVNLLPPFCMVAAPVVFPSSVYSIPPMGRSGVGNPVTTVTVTDSLPGVMPSYYLPSGTQATGTRYPNIVSVAPSMILPQAAGGVSVAPYPVQAIPCYPLSSIGSGIVYQPVVMPPVLLQPAMLLNNNSNNQQQSEQAGPSTQQQHQQQQTVVENSLAAEASTSAVAKKESAANFAEQQQGSSNRRSAISADTSRGCSVSSGESFVGDSSSGADPSISPSILGSLSSTQAGSSEYSVLWSNSQAGSSDQSKLTNGTGKMNGNIMERPVVRNTPPWMRTVTSTQEYLFKYQIPGRDLQEVLEQDRARLQYLEQPPLLDDQLQQLMSDMAAENQRGLGWDETETTASSSGTDDNGQNRSALSNGIRNSQFMNTLIYEENAPMPPPTSTA